MSDETPCHHPGCNCHAAPVPSSKPFSVGPSFVLLCLGAVALIAFIVYLFVPLQWLLGMQSAQTRALADARFISMTLNIYAHENAGQFPQAPGGEGSSANLAYEQLVPFYMHKHKESFHREGSAWTPQPLGSIESPVEKLAPGENHYAYVNGLSKESNPHLPLIADGFMENEPGRYSRESGQRGYVQEGRAIVFRVDGSSLISEITDEGRVQFQGADGVYRDVFEVKEGWLTPAQQVLNPAKAEK